MNVSLCVWLTALNCILISVHSWHPFLTHVPLSQKCTNLFYLLVPEIILGPLKQIALAGSNITLTCATAPNNDSALLVSWQRNGQSISLSKHRQTLEHIPENGSVSSLHLNHVSELDEGVYQCTARNDLGLDVSRPARLTVQCKYFWLDCVNNGKKIDAN